MFISFFGMSINQITIALDLTIIAVTKPEPLSYRDLICFVQILPFRQVFSVFHFPFSFLLFIKIDHDFYHWLSYCKYTTLISKGIFLSESYGNPQPTRYWFSFPFECQFSTFKYWAQINFYVWALHSSYGVNCLE